MIHFHTYSCCIMVYKLHIIICFTEACLQCINYFFVCLVSLDLSIYNSIYLVLFPLFIIFKILIFVIMFFLFIAIFCFFVLVSQNLLLSSMAFVLLCFIFTLISTNSINFTITISETLLSISILKCKDEITKAQHQECRQKKLILFD